MRAGPSDSTGEHAVTTRPAPASPLLVSLLAAVALTGAACAAPDSTGPGESPGTPPTEGSAPASTQSSSPVASPTEPARPSASAPAANPRSVTVNTSGDLLWNDPLFEGARTEDGFDFRPMLASLRPFLEQSDLAICHHEVTVAAPEGPFTGWPRFRAPQETVEAIADAGFNVCTTASNHTVDDGWDGIVRTLDVLDEHGIETVGSWATQEEAEEPDLFTTDDGVVVGIVSQTYSTNQIPVPAGREWAVDMLDPDAAIEDARAAREAGADVVIFHMHAGDEYVHEPNADQEWVAQRVTASGEVDLVIGQHSHWVQPIEKVNGVWVVYSTGNLMASMRGERPGTHDGMLVEVEFVEDEDGAFSVDGLTWAPTHITDAHNDPTGRPRVLLIPDELQDADPALRERLEASAARTRQVVGGQELPELSERLAPTG